MTQNDNGHAEKPDPMVQEIENALLDYQRGHPLAEVTVKRQNPVAIRIRIVDPDFVGLDRIEREPNVWKILERLPEDVFANITMLLLLTPDEAEKSLANLEFEDPIPSRL